MKNFLALLAASATALSVTACSPERSALDMPPGKYQKDVATTDSNGVTTEHKDTTTVNEDAYGRKTAIVQSRTTEKPPGFWNGLFHKATTDQSTEVIREK